MLAYLHAKMTDIKKFVQFIAQEEYKFAQFIVHTCSSGLKPDC